MNQSNQSKLHAKIADTRLNHLHQFSDVAWGEFIRQLKYKSEWASRKVSVINRYYPSSKRCNHCCFVNETMPLSVREWTCPECTTH